MRACVRACTCVYRVAVAVFVEVPGSIETPLHLMKRLWGVGQLREEERKTEQDSKFK